MKTVKIYAVISSRGLYEDYQEDVEKCFTNLDDAVEYARNIDESHRFESPIPNKISDDVEEHWYDDVYDPQIEKFCREHDIPTQEDMSDVPSWMCSRTAEQNIMVAEFANEIEQDYDDWCIKYLTEHYPEYTEKDWYKMLEATDHMYDRWHECEVKELELVVSDDFKI